MRDLVQKDISEFYIWNRGSVGTVVVWDACKAFKHIAFKAHKDRINNLRTNNLLSNIRNLEDELKQNPL